MTLIAVDGSADPLPLSPQATGSWSATTDWFALPDDLAPGEYDITHDRWLVRVTVVDERPLGTEPAVTVVLGARVIDTNPCGCEAERQVCLTVDAEAPGAAGWTLQAQKGNATEWVPIPEAGLEGVEVCLPLGCVAVEEACVDLTLVDPHHIEGAELGTFCTPVDPVTTDTGEPVVPSDTAVPRAPAEEPRAPAMPSTRAGCGCSQTPRVSLAWLLVMVPWFARRTGPAVSRNTIVPALNPERRPPASRRGSPATAPGLPAAGR